jgi:hypothetical protein
MLAPALGERTFCPTGSASSVPTVDETPCPRCWKPLRHPIRFEPAVYAFLLGGYLGDGCIVRVNPRKQSMRLTITLDDRLPDIQQAFLLACRRTFPTVNVRLVPSGGCSHVLFLHHHLPCLFPQHGAGPKHQRTIRLEPWQQAVVDEHPWELLRGFMYSDGCSFTNWATTADGGRYEYLTYDFSNRSADILDLVMETTQLLGLRPKRYWKNVRWARRRDVTRIERRIGTKQEVPLVALPAIWSAGASWHDALDQLCIDQLPRPRARVYKPVQRRRSVRCATGPRRRSPGPRPSDCGRWSSRRRTWP